MLATTEWGRALLVAAHSKGGDPEAVGFGLPQEVGVGRHQVELHDHARRRVCRRSSSNFGPQGFGEFLARAAQLTVAAGQAAGFRIQDSGAGIGRRRDRRSPRRKTKKRKSPMRRVGNQGTRAFRI